MNKKVLKVGFFWMLSTLCASMVFANPYLGIDVLKTNYPLQPRFGSNIFGKTPIGFNGFIGYQFPKTGYQFPENFFVEAGYETGKSKKRTATIFEGDFYPGAINPNVPDEFQVFETKIKMEHPYLGVGLNYLFPDCTTFSLLVGASWSKLKASFDIVADDISVATGFPFTAAEIAEDHRNFKKRKLVPMLKLGLSHEISNCVFVRLTGTWRKLNKFKVITQETDRVGPLAILKLKNGFSAGVGLFYSF